MCLSWSYLFAGYPNFWIVKKNIGVISAWHILSPTDNEISLLHRDFLFLFNVAHSSCFLLLMPSLFPSKFLHVDKYLHFFHSGFEILLMLYCSVLSSFAIRFLFDRGFLVLSVQFLLCYPCKLLPIRYYLHIADLW